MLQDKHFALDLLDMAKHLSSLYTKAGIESSHPQVRQTFLDFGQQSLSEQWEMYQLAEQKGWYPSGSDADAQEVQKVKQLFQSDLQKIQNPQPAMV